MASVSLTPLRAGNYSYEGYLSVWTYTLICSRAINQSSFTYPVQELTFDDAYSGAGATADIKADMTIIVRDGNTDTIKARLRVAAGAVSGSTLQIMEVGNNIVNFADNDRIDIVDEYRIWDKLVSATIDFDKDSRIDYVDQNTSEKPLANGNGAFFGLPDAGETFATVALSAADSKPLDVSNVSGLTYLWDVQDGTITSGVATDQVITATFPVGQRHVTLTVTDADNGKSTIKEIPVKVDDAPLDVRVESLRCVQGQGWSASFELGDEAQATIENLPDGALVCYFERENYNGTIASYGNDVSDRSHMKFVGYLKRDTVNIDAERNVITFEALGPMGILEQTAALPQLLEAVNTPSSWQQTDAFTLQFLVWYLFYWHTSAATVFDLVVETPSLDSLYRIAESNTNSLADQIRAILASYHNVITCDRIGRFRFKDELDYESASFRNNYAVEVCALEEQDIVEIEIIEEHLPLRFKQVQVEAISSTLSSATPLFARGTNAPTAGFGSTILSNQIVPSQAQLNQLAGRFFARQNRLFYNPTLKRYEYAPEGVRVVLPDGYDVFDPEQLEYVTLNLASSTWPRRSYDTTRRWWVREASITHDPETGTKDVVLTLDMETFGLDGVTYLPPTAADSGLEPLPDENLANPGFGDFTPPPLSPGDITSGVQSLAALLFDGNIARTTDFESDTPTWDTVSTGISGISAGVVDAFSPAYISSGSVNIWSVNGAGNLVYTEDIFGVTPTNTTKLSTGLSAGAAYSRYDVATERGFEDYVAVVYIGTSGQNTSNLYWSTDNSTFNTHVLLANGENASERSNGFVHVSGRVNGLSYATAANGALYKYTFGGSSSTLLTAGGLGVYAIRFVYVPFLASGNDSVFWFATVDNAFAGNPRLWKYNNGTTTDYTIASGSQQFAPTGRFGKRPFAVADSDPNTIVFCGWDGSDFNQSDFAVCVSRDGGLTWTVNIADSLNIPTGKLPFGCAIAGDSANTLFVWGGAVGSTGGAFINVMTLTGGTVTNSVNKYNPAGSVRVMNIFGG